MSEGQDTQDYIQKKTVASLPNNPVIVSIREDDQVEISIKPSPLPINTVLVLSIIILSEPISSTILFPFVYFMVKDFNLAEPEDIGNYVGLLSSAYFLAQLLTAIIWGWLSDKYGRKPILLIGLLGNTITMLSFGMSLNFTQAIASRFFCGMLNGNVGVAKSVLGEITDSSNRSIAFTIIGLSYGIGSIIGPGIGGMLSDPTKNIPFLKDVEFLKIYPYFLPCALSSALTIIGLAIGILYLPETCKNVGGYHPISPQAVESAQTIQDLSISQAYPTERNTNRETFAAAKAYGLLALHDIIFLEVFPLWAVERPTKGLGFDGQQIGLCLSIVGIFSLLCSLAAYPAASKYATSLTIFRISSFLFIPATCFFPLISTYIQDKTLVWASLISASGFRAIVENFAYTSVMILVSISAGPGGLGRANGIAQTFAALARAIGPASGGIIWAWSCKNQLFPFNHVFVFVVVIALCCILIIQSLSLNCSEEDGKNDLCNATH